MAATADRIPWIMKAFQAMETSRYAINKVFRSQINGVDVFAATDGRGVVVCDVADAPWATLVPPKEPHEITPPLADVGWHEPKKKIPLPEVGPSIYRECTRCGGDGTDTDEDDADSCCPRCGGHGKLEENRRIVVDEALDYGLGEHFLRTLFLCGVRELILPDSNTKPCGFTVDSCRGLLMPVRPQK